jgi:signal transduction histidine kinase
MSVVLLVDDSPADRALFRTILSRGGYTVHEVATGREALVKARELRPHALVLDVNLPDIDGHDVCRAVRSDPSMGGTPVLMLTVRDNDSDVLAGLEAGADDYVPKDSDSRIILARVKRLVMYRRMATLAVLNEQLIQVGRLLAGIVHEIRGPLSVIRGSAELMRLNLDTSNEQNRQWVDSILRNTQLLQVRLEHLMATVRSGPPALQTVELVPLLRESTDLFIKGTDPRGRKVLIQTDWEDPLPRVRTDPGRLLQVLLSLYSNAYDALGSVPMDGAITVRPKAVTDAGRDWVQIDVMDNGPGIPPDCMGRIFEPFYTTKENGTGYGLYLASEILKEQGGRLTACNSPSGGACFSIWLPVAQDTGS